MHTLYGIKNCDTIKKARLWLDKNNIDYQFHDYRREGLDYALLEHFTAELDWEKMLNRRSTSWKQLSERQKTDLSREKTMQLMLETPTLIKRPILDTGDKIILGFTAEKYQAEL